MAAFFVFLVVASMTAVAKPLLHMMAMRGWVLGHAEG
jgi:hypothetical protein